MMKYGDERKILKAIENRNNSWLGCSLRRDCLLTAEVDSVLVAN